MMNKKDAEKIVKDLSEKPFVCSEHCIETERGYVITTKEKQKYARSKKQTNADRIRNMSDEELAEFLEGFTVCDHCEYYKNERCAMENPCVHAFAEAMAFKWLQAEVDEEN